MITFYLPGNTTKSEKERKKTEKKQQQKQTMLLIRHRLSHSHSPIIFEEKKYT